MVGLFYILLFWLIGNALSLVTGGYVSGNIIGMILVEIFFISGKIHPSA